VSLGNTERRPEKADFSAENAMSESSEATRMAKVLRLAVIAALAASIPQNAHAVLTYNDDVTPDVILLGSGIANGGFTVDRAMGVELGLRGKLRFDGSNQPQNTFNFSGVSGAGHGVYTFDAGGVDLLNGPAPVWADATTPIWNFEWSINVNYDGSAGNFDGPGNARDLADLTYTLSIDFNPGAPDAPAVVFDPINVFFADHAFGDNSTPNGGGTVAVTPNSYHILTNSLSLAQQSWNMEFFDAPDSPNTFDPNVPGVYTIRLDAYDGASLLASTSIDVMVNLPEASPLLFGGMICGVLGWWRLRQRRCLEEVRI
jgi:hypothetical protein